MIRIFLVACLVFAARLQAHQIPDDLPASGTTSTVTYDCRRVADDAVQIDGDINEAAWVKAAPMENFQTAYANPKPAKFQTKARLLWSEKHLFLAFECQSNGIQATMTKRDDLIWNEECAELFLCPRGPKAKYYEIDFSPANTIYDSLLLSYEYNEQVLHYLK